MPGEIRRGKAAIDEATKSSGRRGGDFKPFVKSIFWRDDGDERFLLFLNPVDEVPQFDLIEFIETERGYPETAVAKTDPYFGEKTDKFEKDWDATPHVRNVAIAVELEPLVEVVNGRHKAKSFEVMTEEFSRKVIDPETGEATEETEDVVAPLVGVVTQSPSNFFNVLSSCDDTDFPVHETAVRVKRIGKDSNTTYKVDGFEDQEIDLSNLIEYITGVSYLNEEMDALVEEIDGMEPLEAAHIIGNMLLDKRCEELLDEERYEELYSGVSESMDRFGNKKKDKKAAKATRNARPSQRRKSTDTEPVEETTDAVEEKKEKPRKGAVTNSSDPKAKLAELRKRSSSKK